MPPSAVLEFLDYIEKTNYALQSFALIKDGTLICEGYYSPFKADEKRRLYSSSKSIAALAVGKLVTEGLVSLDAPLVSYFPEYVKGCDARLAAATVEDALIMSLPLSSNPYGVFEKKHPDDVTTMDSWCKDFFSGKLVCDKPKGTLFNYNSHASYILGALTDRLVGKSFIEYLRPELDKIGVSADIDCVKSPEGIAWASSGVLATTRDFALIAQFMMNLGEWDGEQLISREYMERATTKRIDTAFELCDAPNTCGYGYQIWMHPHGFGMYGMLGQCAFCFPDKSFIFVCNSNVKAYLPTIYYAAEKLYDSIDNAPLAADESSACLAERLFSLRYCTARGAARSPIENELCGVYELSQNPMGIDKMELDFGKANGIFRMWKNGEIKEIPFGYGECVDTVFPQKYYSMVFTPHVGDRFPRTLSAGAWTGDRRLMIIMDISDTLLGRLTVTLEFADDGGLAMKMVKNGEGLLGEYQGVAIGKKIK